MLQPDGCVTDVIGAIALKIRPAHFERYPDITTASHLSPRHLPTFIDLPFSAM